MYNSGRMLIICLFINMKVLILESTLFEAKEKNYAAYYWAGFFKNRYYYSQDELFNDLDRKIEHNNKTVVIGSKLTREEVLQYLDIVQEKKGWTAKLKKKYVYNEKKNIIDNWDEFEIIQTQYRELDIIGNSNFYDYEIITEPKVFKIADFLNQNDSSYSNHYDRIKKLAEQIMSNKKFEPIVIEPNQQWVIEGQHRIRALKMLGFKTFLAYQIIDLD